MQSRRRRRGNAAVLVALTAVVAFVGTVQLRSQAEVVRSLEGQDPTTLAFLIDDLHQANETLAGEALTLAGRRDALQAGGGEAAAAQLQQELADLQVVAGAVPVHGPGVVLVIDAPLTSLDLQDAANQLRGSGAEALAINDHRVVEGTVYRTSGPGSAPAVSLDGVALHGPWTLTAIGEPSRLGATADAMTRALRADPRVRSVDYRAPADIAIRATVAPRPFVYGST